MIQSKNENIIVNSQELKQHSKASEKYVDVTLKLPYGVWDGWIPTEYRRTGVSLKLDDEVADHIEKIHSIMSSITPNSWLENERDFWDLEKSGASVTRAFFDALAEGGWKCRKCNLPANPNFARRIQDLKELGYTLATDTKRYCHNCNKNTTQLNLIPIPRVAIAGNGYETWSLTLRKRILRTLDNYDVYEGKKGSHLLPDHKFSEIRWDEDTKEENPDTMTVKEIQDKFQLLSNQRNQQKREACRTCFQTDLRQYPFGIEFFYDGNKHWDSSIPRKGKGAELGCYGCGWYDMEKWRKELNRKNYL